MFIERGSNMLKREKKADGIKIANNMRIHQK